MPLVTFGREPVFDLVTPKQFVWYRDFTLCSGVTGTLLMGYPMALTADGNLTNFTKAATGNIDAFILVVDTDRDDVNFGDTVTVVDNAAGFVGKVSTDLVSGTLNVGDQVTFDETAEKYVAATTGDKLLAVVQSPAQGGQYVFRYVSANEQGNLS